MENSLNEVKVITIFPMALCWQIFYAGPIVRFIFRKIFERN